MKGVDFDVEFIMKVGFVRYCYWKKKPRFVF